MYIKVLSVKQKKVSLIINSHRTYLTMLCEHRTGLQISSKLKYGNIKVLGVKHKLN
jgi:hypothetical protein